MDRLSELWQLQAEQQVELELDPSSMSDVDRARAFTDYLANMYEEVAEIGKASPSYKRHILLADNSRSGVLDGCVDAMKMAMTIAQLQGITSEEFIHAFLLKTDLVRERARQARLKLEAETLVLGFDLDDVFADLTPFREEANSSGNAENSFAAALSMNERMKHRFYEEGGFRDLAPIPFAAETARRIKKRYGALHVIVTARPQWKYKRLHGDTAWWLKRHGIPYDVLLFSRNKVEAISEHICPAWPKVFVEDHLRNARDLTEAGIDVLLFDRPHNQSAGSESLTGERVFGWYGVDGVEAAIARRLER